MFLAAGKFSADEESREKYLFRKNSDVDGYEWVFPTLVYIGWGPYEAFTTERFPRERRERKLEKDYLGGN